MRAEATAPGKNSKVIPLNAWRGRRQTLPHRLTGRGRPGRNGQRLAIQTLEVSVAAQCQQEKNQPRATVWFRRVAERRMASYVGALAGAGAVSVGTPSGVVWMTVGLATVLALAIMTGRNRHPPNPAAASRVLPATELDESERKEAA